MAKMKADKLIGGKQVRLPRIDWAVTVEGITLSGSASDERSAALAASAARQSITDALAVDVEIKGVDSETKDDDSGLVPVQPWVKSPR
jgi:hypothetical protein